MNEKRKYKIKGTVTDKRDGRGVPNLKVEAWDKDLLIDDLLGIAVTDENGRFTISFNESYYQEICVDRKPDIYFKVYKGSRLVSSTEDSVLWNVARSDIEITLSVKLPSPKNKDKHRVEGHIFFKYRLPAVGITVRLYSLGFGGVETLLGKGKTDDKGFYEVSYDPGGKSVNLEVRVVNARGKEITLSDTKFKVGKHEVLNLVVPASAWPLAQEETMNKNELLELEKNAHLTINELRAKELKLAKPLEKRLERRAHRKVVTRLAGGSETLRKLVEKISVPLGEMPDKLKLQEATLKALRKAVSKDKQLAGDEDLKKEFEALEKSVAAPVTPGARPDATLADSLRLDEPLAFHPEFGRELDAARLFRLSDATGLGDKTAELLIKEVGKAKDITEGRLETLVKDKKLTSKEAKAIGLAASLYNVLDERPELVAAAKSGISDIRELVKNDKAAWTKIIKDSETKPPGDISADAYADLLVKKVERLFPMDALAYRFTQVKVGETLKQHVGLSELRKLNPSVSLVGMRDFDALKTDRLLAAADVKKLRARYEETVRLTNRFSGMRLAEVLDDDSLSEDNRIREVIRRADLVSKFFADNTDVLGTDLTPGSKETRGLKFAAETSDGDKAMVLATARTYQRAFTVTDDVADAESLVVGGFPSALCLAMSRPNKVAAKTGLKEEIAARYHAKARHIAAGVTAHAGTTIDIVAGMFADTAVGNVSTEIADYLKEIPGFADFFGNQNFCNCKHCQSILGPAAYFVDLMCFVDEWVTQEFFADKPDHPLNLKSRRPDLWTLELTCENTNKPIPYLFVINDILENAVAKDAGFAGDFGDRVAVETKIYKDTLPDQVDSFKQPLNLPFEELRTYLRHFERSLADMAEAGNATGDALARLCLSLPPKDYELITHANTNLPYLRRIYGVQLTEFGSKIRKFDAQKLLKPMGVTRDELGELIATRFVTSNGTVNIRIKGEKRSSDSIQNDIENILELTRSALDRMHRFVRLWRATGWRTGELDLVLTHLEQAGLGLSLNADVVRAVARVHRLQTASDVSVEELIALWSTVPRHAVLQSLPASAVPVDPDAPTVYPATASPLARCTVPLFDRLFNQKSFVEADGTYPKDGTTFLHPALANIPSTATDPNLHRLLAGTGSSEDEFLQLIVGLALPLGIDPESGDDNKKGFVLNERNLSLLYRHSRLAKLLKVGLPELFALAALTPELANAHVEDLIDLEALLRFHTWYKTTDWSLAELVQIVRPAHPARATSQVTVAGTAGGESVTYVATLEGTAQPVETITLRASADLDAIIADWNDQAQHTVAYRSDEFGVQLSVGNRLSIRTKGTGAGTKIELTADTASIFTGGAPQSFVGRELALPLPQPVLPDAKELAQEIVDQVQDAESLVFSDKVFALLPATSPVATSAAPVPSTAGTESVTYTPMLNGHTEASETINMAANADLDAVVIDWNSKATLTRAYRSDANGKETATGNHLSIEVKGATGSNTKITITADSGSLFTAVVPKEYKGAEVTEEQSRALIAANMAVLEAVDAERRYRLKSGFDPNATLTLPASVDAALAPLLRDLLGAYHSKQLLLSLLPSRVDGSVDVLPYFVDMVGANLDDDEYFRELRGDMEPEAIARLIGQVRPLGLLFAQEVVFDAENLAFILEKAALFGVSDFRALETAAVQSIELFRGLSEPWVTKDEVAPDLRGVLLAFDSVTRFGGADQEELASVLDCDLGLLQSLKAQLSLASTPFKVLQQLLDAVEFSKHVGVGGSALKLAQSAAYDDLATASAAVQAGFRTKYQDESEWETKFEPFRDSLLSRRRDGLVAYLVHSGAPQFDEFSDLYHYFLLDVGLEGCARTSRVASAIDSVQLYVQRCLMNLEETKPGDTNPVHILPESIPKDEWEWRKNYRVWEANRKIFLYPENYIEPELRDNKTPLFETLEEELLSKEITDEAILEAYARYLRGFDELAHLTIAGSYHEKDEDEQRDVLHLFGVTADDPPTYYYRRVENAHYGASSDEYSTHWGPWEKVDTQIPVRKISPLMHNGQLYVFWIRYVTKASNKVKGGESRFVGYQHRAYIEFSRRKLDGSWTTPQKLRLDESPFGPATFPESYQDDGVVLDPIIPKSSQTQEILWFTFTFYSNFEPLYDDRTHEVPKDDYTLSGFEWDRLYPATGDDMFLRGINFQMWSPVDLYRLKIGPRFELEDPVDYGVPWLNPVIFVLIWLITGGEFDLTSLLPPRLVWSRVNGERRILHTTSSGLPCFDTYTYATLLLDEARFKQYEESLAATGPAHWTGPQWDEEVTDYIASILSEKQIANIPADTSLDVVNGSVGDVIIRTSRDAFYLQSEVRGDGKYYLRRLNTSLSEDIADVLFNRGLDELLATETQLDLKEHATGLNLVSAEVSDATRTGEVDFNGPMGPYLREVFFHIPFLIANHLNSQGRFEDAQRWYHYIFDPTASESIQGLPTGLSDEERRRRELDRNWRYREFRGLMLDSLRTQLTDGEAIDEYRRDPFNPHAIARLRISSYQKAIVMKYVDNLLDWGDDLFMRAFAQLNPEYLREATLKYVTAQEILGERPAQLGDCGEGKLSPKIFPKIKDSLTKESEFLMEMESLIAIRSRLSSMATVKNKLVAVEAEKAMRELKYTYEGAAVPLATAPAPPAAVPLATPDSMRRLISSAPAETKKVAARLTAADVIVAKRKTKGTAVTLPQLYTGFLNPKIKWIPDWGISFIREISPIFCVPGNERMLGYWDRVADRLYKLRHCMDIEGVPWQLPLFAPSIDLGLLVGGKAAGLSLDDILAAGAGNLPPYRFGYLIEKAKAYAATVQGFGAALLGALEKRDAEELARLRNTHQKNILTLTTEVKRNELKAAEEGVEIATRRKAAAQYRYDYYNGLISAGLMPAEITQTTARITSSVLRTAASITDIIAGIAHLIPQVGSPFAMKYGGIEVGMSSTAWGKVMSRVADVSDGIALVSGILAGFERREQGWNHQKKLAENDLKTIEKESMVAELRKAIAERGLELHEKAKEQHDEVIDLFEDKFSNLGLYTYLSRTLQQLHRDAYSNALAIARLAEQAYRFERPGDNTIFVGGEWDASRSGLLAGERLNLALQNMEKRFIETNTRKAEINQSFSLAQIDPQALIDLKEIGRCDFSIPEFYFDLFYPGQYRRRVRAIRLTIPCITGPYTNISAMLTLLRSHIRRDAVLGAVNMLEVPAGGTTSVATSTAQGDAGVFELSFRDERYMPFEGAGVVSTWRLELPAHFRPFDYQSINDVILNVSYTAEEDGVLRQQVESQNADIEGSLLHFLSKSTVTRVFSLRQEFSNAFNRLMQATAGTPVTIDINERHFPMFLQGRALTAASANMVLVVQDRSPVGTVSISVNGTAATGFSDPTNPPVPGDPFGGLPAKTLGGAFAAGLKKKHTITVNDAGNLAAGDAAGSPTFDQEKLQDILLVVEYHL